MPIYPMICDECNRTEDVVARMKDKLSHKCSCGAQMRRNWQESTPLRNCQGREYTRPIVSNSLAMNPNQIAEHRKLFPNIKVHPDGRPEFTNFKDHDDYLKKTGFKKNKQKVRHKFRKKAAV